MFNSPSLADIAAVSGNRNNDGFGGDWFALVILLAIFGWGGNGFGWGGNGGSQAGFTDAAVQRGFDQQAVVGKLDRLGDGLCSLGYDQLAQMNGINVNMMQGFNAAATQLADCCCTTQRSIDQVRFDMATDTCAITTALERGFNSVNQNINDQFCQAQMRDMQRTIDEQNSVINALNLAQSQAVQNQTIISALRPAPVPSYNVPNPYAGYGYGTCGCNAGCNY